MQAINYTTLRENMKSYMDLVNDEYETLIIARKNNKNVVMMSEESYNNLLENNYVRSSEVNYQWILESKKQMEKGKFVLHDSVKGIYEE